jgi:hypothetical protein
MVAGQTGGLEVVRSLRSSMSALGQKRTSERDQVMSALPPKADIAECDRHVRFVPKADISARPELFNLPYSAPDPRLGL